MWRAIIVGLSLLSVFAMTASAAPTLRTFVVIQSLEELRLIPVLATQYEVAVPLPGWSCTVFQNHGPRFDSTFRIYENHSMICGLPGKSATHFLSLEVTCGQFADPLRAPRALDQHMVGLLARDRTIDIGLRCTMEDE